MNLDELAKNLASKSFRMNSLYKIIDKDSNLIDFTPNWMQKELFENDHPKIINLKARQLGSTTYFALSVLDDALFNSNQNVFIISLSQSSGEKIFKRIIQNAYNHLPPMIKRMVKVTRERAQGYEFSNGSFINVGTSGRSETVTHLLCTEFGKVCARFPQKAEEIITGSLNAVPKSAKVIIESTAEGSSGYFYDLCQKSMRLSDDIAGAQYKFFFFPWYKHYEYVETDHRIVVPRFMEEYFEKLREDHNIVLSDDQKRFYTIKYFENEDKCKQEYPSIPQEAFLASSDGFWYQKHMCEARANNQITKVPYDPSLPVYTAWDLGRHDPTSIWFFQRYQSGVIHLIDYYENVGFGFSHYAKILQEKPYNYSSHFVPHDAETFEKASNESYVTIARQLGYTLTVMKRKNPLLGINHVRQLLPQCYFDAIKCEVGILSLEAYKKKWNEAMQMYSSDAVHDKHSHAADAFRTLADGVHYLKYGNEVTEHEVAEFEAHDLRDRLTRVI